MGGYNVRMFYSDVWWKQEHLLCVQLNWNALDLC